MNLTKKQCEELVERLADKTLSFGQRLKIPCKTMPMFDVGTIISRDNKAYDVLYGSLQIEGYVETLHENDIQERHILGHPILLGDVLEMIVEKFKNEDIAIPDGYVDSMVSDWWECGFTKSLQQILEEAEWMQMDYSKARATTRFGKQTIPKSPAIRELFSLLLTLFPDD